MWREKEKNMCFMPQIIAIALALLFLSPVIYIAVADDIRAIYNDLLFKWKERRCKKAIPYIPCSTRPYSTSDCRPSMDSYYDIHWARAMSRYYGGCVEDTTPAHKKEPSRNIKIPAYYIG